MDEQTRNRLWSALTLALPESSQSTLPLIWVKKIFNSIWVEHFKEPVDSMPMRDKEIRAQLRNLFLNSNWYEVYDLIEFLLNADGAKNYPGFVQTVPRILAEEMAGCRVLNGLLIEITNETELTAIEESLLATRPDQYSPTHAHLQQALELLASRRNPDYRNSVKESISAIESLIQILTGDSKADFAKGLKLLQTRVPIHGALRSALTSLYGYSSDAEGIRHALTEDPSLGAVDAKFMLVVCSAFVLFLIQKASP